MEASIIAHAWLTRQHRGAAGLGELQWARG
jgi:hypothetical protein